jgi:hypothetical protein
MSAIAAPAGTECADCRLPVEEGEPVVYVNDDLVHVDCEPSALADLMNMRSNR